MLDVVRSSLLGGRIPILGSFSDKIAKCEMKLVLDANPRKEPVTWPEKDRCASSIEK
jgi:hypothetical protein